MRRKLRGIRGAVFCGDTIDDISNWVIRLYDNLLEANNLTEDDIVSLIFSVTNDIRALNPALALRQSGRASDVALFCVAEAISADSKPNVVRVLVHAYSNTPAMNIYLNGAETLRPDRYK